MLDSSRALARSLKQSARGLIHRALDISGAIDREIARGRRDIILMYHAVETERSTYPYSVSPRSLEKHIRFLQRHFQIVSLDQMFGDVANRSRVAFTFDDGYQDFYLNAYPLLRRYRVPATVFVPTRYIGQLSDVAHDKLFGCAKRHVTWDQIREMQSSGLITFESHTHTHYNAVERMDALRQEVLTSMEILQRNIGYTPKYFAYPYGACNSATHAIVLACGFKKLLTVEALPVTGLVTEGRFDVSRHNERLSSFKMTAAGITVRSLTSRILHRTGSRISSGQPAEATIY